VGGAAGGTAAPAPKSRGPSKACHPIAGLRMIGVSCGSQGTCALVPGARRPIHAGLCCCRVTVRRCCWPVVNQQSLVAESWVFHLRRCTMRISRSSAHTKVRGSHSRKTPSLGDLRPLRATILDHPRRGVARILPLFPAPDQTHSRSHTSKPMRANTPVSSTMSLMGIQRSSSSALPRITPGAIHHARNARRPKVAGIIGGVGTGSTSERG
jgi:hypothetical protein